MSSPARLVVPSGREADLYRPLSSGRIQCTACARRCQVGEGQVGFCGIRGVVSGRLYLLDYGRVMAAHVDPIEKKPVVHYRPGSKVLSIATSGCSWACRFCQNYDISQRRQPDGTEQTPEQLVSLALKHGCEGIAYTYNQPSVFMEFARDVGKLAHSKGLFNIFVSNGYDTQEGADMMKGFLDCITVDFKGSGEAGFLRRYVSVPDAAPIFNTMLELKSKVHIEVTDLVIPQVGDSIEAAEALCSWIYDNLGPQTPLHFLRFHPDYKMMDIPVTPVKTLERHVAVGRAAGLEYVYLGNVPGHPDESTYCPECNNVLIKRDGYRILQYELDAYNRCVSCGHKTPIVGPLAKSWSEERFFPVLS
jgi:pyruvate formate lyase activating enzyme